MDFRPGAIRSCVGVVHGVDVIVGQIQVHLQIDHLHLFGVPVAGRLEDVVDWDPRVDQDGLLDYG